MHTVNKAYTILKQEGYVKLDRRKGAVVAVDADRMKAIEDLTVQMRVILAEAVCRNISCKEIHEVMDQIFREFSCCNKEGGANDVV